MQDVSGARKDAAADGQHRNRQFRFAQPVLVKVRRSVIIMLQMEQSIEHQEFPLHKRGDIKLRRCPSVSAAVVNSGDAPP